MAKKCTCGFWFTCEHHSRQMSAVDDELSSYRIIRAMEKANRRAENAVTNAESWAERHHVAIEVILYGTVAGLAFLWFAA